MKGWYERRSYDRRSGRYVAVRHSAVARRRNERLFWHDVQHAYRNTPSMKSLPSIKRRYWYTVMVKRGPIGIKDNRRRSNVVLPLSKMNYTHWEKHPNQLDIEGIDTPRKDIKEFRIRGLTVWVGGNIKTNRDFSRRVITESLDCFTDDELKQMKQIYIERLPNELESKQGDVGGQTHIDELTNKKRATMLYLPPGKEEKVTLVHEMVHILRRAQHRISENHGREEKEAELETVARINPKLVQAMIDGKSIGYYDNIPEGSPWLAISHDRNLTTGSIGKSQKGKKLTRGFTRKYDRSEIKKAMVK